MWQILIPVPQSGQIVGVCVEGEVGTVRGIGGAPVCGFCRDRQCQLQFNVRLRFVLVIILWIWTTPECLLRNARVHIFSRVGACARRGLEMWQILIPVPQSGKIVGVCVVGEAGTARGIGGTPLCGFCRCVCSLRCLLAFLRSSCERTKPQTSWDTGMTKTGRERLSLILLIKAEFVHSVFVVFFLRNARVHIFSRVSPYARRGLEMWQILIPVPQSGKIVGVCVVRETGTARGIGGTPVCGFCRCPDFGVRNPTVSTPRGVQ